MTATATRAAVPGVSENPHAGQGSVLLDIGGDVGALVVTMPRTRSDSGSGLVSMSPFHSRDSKASLSFATALVSRSAGGRAQSLIFRLVVRVVVAKRDQRGGAD